MLFAMAGGLLTGQKAAEGRAVGTGARDFETFFPPGNM